MVWGRDHGRLLYVQSIGFIEFRYVSGWNVLEALKLEAGFWGSQNMAFKAGSLGAHRDMLAL